MEERKGTQMEERKGTQDSFTCPQENVVLQRDEAGPTGERREEAVLWGSAGKGPSRLTSVAAEPGHSLGLQQLTEVLVTLALSVQPSHSQHCGPDAWLHVLEESNDSDQHTVLSIPLPPHCFPPLPVWLLDSHPFIPLWLPFV